MQPDADRAEIVAAARSFLGVPFRHQGRTRHGLDCIGLVVAVARDLGRYEGDVTGYQRRTSGNSFMAQMQAEGLRDVPWECRLPGDVVLMHDNHYPCHVAILSETDRIVHAFALRRQVVEEVLTEHWKRRLVGVYRLPWLPC